MAFQQLDKLIGFIRGETPEQLAHRAKRREMLRGFDWEFYLNFYPDLRKNGVNSKIEAKNHWLSSGCAEGRISGTKCAAFLENKKRLDDYLKSLHTSRAPRNAAADNSGPLINILTRSNNRPRFFLDNRASVTSQTYKHYRQLVSYENNATFEYIQQSKVPAADTVKVIKGGSGGTHPYNLFINDLMDRVTEGWIMFLDDDDVLTTPQALSIIAPHLVDENSLVIWKTSFPDKTLPNSSSIHEIKEGGLGSNCFAFHSKHREIARWDDRRAGDYRCFDQLRKHLKPVFMNDILARINYSDRSAGWGSAKDKT